jgi:ribonuclease P protein component
MYQGRVSEPLQRDSFAFVRRSASLRDNEYMPTFASGAGHKMSTADHRLRKHADYQRVYHEGRKQFSASMSYFFALRREDATEPTGPRVGLTAGKVLGKAVERNRIKRRLRDIVRRRVAIVEADVDIVLHPRKSVLTMDFAKLESEVARIFSTIQAAIDKQGAARRAASKVES